MLRSACLSLIVVGVLFGAANANAQQTSQEKADVLYQQAQQLSSAGKYEAALPLFVQAYSTYPQAKYTFGIATCYEGLGDLPHALDAYEQFNQYEPNPEVLNRVKAEVKKIKDKLSKEYGEIYVFSSPSGSQVFVGEISKHNLYKTPVRRWLKAGEHSVFFQKTGTMPRELKVKVEKGEHLYIYAGLKSNK